MSLPPPARPALSPSLRLFSASAWGEEGAPHECPPLQVSGEAPPALGPGASGASPSGISSEFQLPKLVASQVSAQPGGGTRRRPNEASPAAGGRPRQKEHQPAGEGGTRGASPGGTPPQCPLLPRSGAAPASPRPQLAGTRHAPFQSGQAGDHGGAISRGSPSPRCLLENKTQCHPQAWVYLGRREAHGGHAHRAGAHSGGAARRNSRASPRLSTPTPLPSFPPPRRAAGVPLSSPAPPRTRAAVSMGRLAP